MGGRKGRDGLFPATSCIKIAGYFGKLCRFFSFNEKNFSWPLFIHFLLFRSFSDDNKETITVRGCALDSGGL